MTNLNWIQNWYKNQCDGDWEHDYGIKIETLDNPGWSITIDTTNTLNELNDFEWNLVEQSEDDWYGYKVIDGVFEGSGDPNKLEKLIDVFIQLVKQTKSPST
jgi:hypothetical protein